MGDVHYPPARSPAVVLGLHAAMASADADRRRTAAEAAAEGRRTDEPVHCRPAAAEGRRTVVSTSGLRSGVVVVAVLHRCSSEVVVQGGPSELVAVLQRRPAVQLLQR